MIQDKKVIDLAYLQEISNNDSNFIDELISMFLEQIPQYQESLNGLYNAKDWYNLGRMAHKAKSAVLMMGMKSLAEDLKNLEENAKQGKNIDGYNEIIFKFVRDSNLAIKELKEIKEK
ncbi:MAG TPA: Hpt domain-containing protein [Bacteroidales bacterium]|nr:Hpt domain-containing protein [Bacteroidales bacterium]